MESAQLVNALTIAFVACLMPHDPWADNLYLTISTLCFASLATLNHLFPTRLEWLTHVVKAAYTHLVFASLSIAWLWIPALISAVDLVPLAVQNQRLRDVSEATGACARWAAIGWGFHVLGFPLGLLVFFGACTAVYAWERRRRIAAGRRYDYGHAHCLEHLAAWAWLVCVNADRLDFPLVIRLSLGLVVTLALGLIVLGMSINVAAFRSVRAHLPPWFDPRLRASILAKARDNVFSHRWQHYILKPFTPKISNRRVRWSDIETMVDALELDLSSRPSRLSSGPERPFDCVVGVLSGGAFIANYVALRHGIAQVHYARSRLWSRVSILKNAVQSTRYYLGLDNEIAPSFIDPNLDLGGQRVLLVDDSVCTGATLATVAQLCRAHGASEVETLALFCHPDHPTDHYHRASMTPLIWPWGWESD
jgi:adenine/guanine phosphoribosyltransferase-like PRPP-binding protein